MREMPMNEETRRVDSVLQSETIIAVKTTSAAPAPVEDR